MSKQMSKQKTIELSPEGKSSIEVIDERYMIIKAKKITLNNQVAVNGQQI
ncbi:hypothetical protein N7X58_02050 [Leuconostoc mesenteroides]|nr:hypothetical protein [Leuconostoc mesenteroides]MCU4664278.1 hypothetical protein [Leuconostoc mesenteroides]